MAKNSITDYSKTAASNTDIQSVDIDEGCLPSGINNAIRELMADLADMNDGTVSLTSPSFAAATITGDLTVDTNTLHVDSTNNRVGIGTSSPSTNLTVSSGASSAAVHSYTKLEIESSSHGALQLSGSTGAEQWIWFADDSSSTPVGGITYYHGGPYMAFRVEGSERMRIDSSGNVGIGITPTAKLHVAGTIQSQTGSSVAQMYTDGGAAYFSSVGAYPSLFLTNGSERMRITSSGNVGIGTSTPSALLNAVDASGSGTATQIASGTAHSQTRFAARTEGYNGIMSLYDSGGTEDVRLSAKSGQDSYINNGGNVGIGTSSGFNQISGTETAVNIYNSNAAALYLNSGVGHNHILYSGNAGHLAFYDATAAAERMRIDSSGNVGIGTTSPTVLGDFYKTAYPEIRVRSASYTNTFGVDTVAGKGVLGSVSNNPFTFVTNNTERMRIDSSGNVLSGRTSISAREAFFANDGSVFTNGNLFPLNSGGTSGRFVRLDGFSDALYIQWDSGTADAGGVKLNYGATSFVSSSDERLKQNIQSLNTQNAYNFVKTVRATTFEWKTDAVDGTHIGFIAQDWEQQYPELISNNELTRVTTDDGDEGAKGLMYSETVVVLTAALQEAITKIEDLESRVATLEGN